MESSEEEIVGLLSNPSMREKVFSELFRKYQERIYWHIRKMVISHEDSNDVMQNTFMKAWNGLDGFRGDSLFSTWLYRIATNETITFLSNVKNKAHSTLEENEVYLQRNLQTDPFFTGDELQMKLQKAILTLPEKQRLVFNMKYFENFKYEQMESILGTSVGALKASYHHAVKKIELYFEENE